MSKVKNTINFIYNIAKSIICFILMASRLLNSRKIKTISSTPLNAFITGCPEQILIKNKFCAIIKMTIHNKKLKRLNKVTSFMKDYLSRSFFCRVSFVMGNRKEGRKKSHCQHILFIFTVRWISDKGGSVQIEFLSRHIIPNWGPWRGLE